MPINFLCSFDLKSCFILDDPLFLQSVPIPLLHLNPAAAAALVVAEAPPTLPRSDALHDSSFCNSIFPPKQRIQGQYQCM